MKNITMLLAALIYGVALLMGGADGETSSVEDLEESLTSPTVCTENH